MKKFIIVLVIVLILGAGWYLLSPLFIDQTVNEDFPLASMTEADYKNITEAMVGLDIDMPTKDDLTQMTATDITTLEREIVSAKNQNGDENVDEQMNTPNEQQVVAEGEFTGADSFHQGEGSATVYKLTDNSLVLRLEDFKVTNGPDLRVVLAKDPNNVKSDYIEIAKLKGNAGNQNYSLDSSLDLNQYPYVVIYCKPFSVTFASANLN